MASFFSLIKNSMSIEPNVNCLHVFYNGWRPHFTDSSWQVISYFPKKNHASLTTTLWDCRGVPSPTGTPPTPHPRSSSREPTAAWARVRVPPARTASPARSPPSRAAAAPRSWAPAPRVTVCVEVQLIFQILRFERGELLFQLVLVEVRGVPHGLAQGVLHLPHLLRMFVDVVHDL